MSGLVDPNARCARCQRGPAPGERYGSAPDEWDHANICPVCWALIGEGEAGEVSRETIPAGGDDETAEVCDCGGNLDETVCALGCGCAIPRCVSCGWGERVEPGAACSDYACPCHRWGTMVQVGSMIGTADQLEDLDELDGLPGKDEPDG